MKGFASGVGGVCVVMLAIMGTVLCGFALGAEERHTTTTEYSYTADTTGLFDVSESKKFTDYSPAANWTGWRANAKDEAMGGISYYTSSKINGYPIPTGAGEAKTDKTYFSLANVPGNADPPGSRKTVDGYIAITDDDPDISTSGMSKAVFWPRVITVKQLFDNHTYWSSGMSEIDLLYDAVDIHYRSWAAPISAWQEVSIRNVVPAWGYVTCQILPLAEYSKVVTLRVYPEQDLVSAIDESGTELWKSTMAGTTIAFKQETQVVGEYPVTDWIGFDDDVYTPGNLSTRIQYEQPGQTAYLDISQGVVPTTSANGAYWSNGYTNGKIDMLIRWNEDTSTKTHMWMRMPVTVTGTDGATTSMNYGVEVVYSPKAGDNWSINITAYNLTNAKVAGYEYAGNFSKGILLSLDMIDDTITAYAIDTFSSFQDYTLLTEPVATISQAFSKVAGYNPGQVAPGGISAASMTVGTDNTVADPSKAVPTIGIVGTSVYMGDKTLVMSDPTIQPVNLWYGKDPWELRLFSFAIVGDSLTLSDTSGELDSWAVTDGKITVNGKAHTLSNLWIQAYWTGSEWEISMIFGDETPQKAIQVATTTDDAGPTIALGGYWYFSSAYYAGQEKVISTYDFDFQHFIFDSNAAILCYMGILIMGAIVAKRLGGLGIYDMIVLLFAGICGFVLMA